MTFLHSLREYARQLASHWKGSMSGGAGIIVALANLGLGWTNAQTFFWGAVVAFAIGSYCVWNDERRARFAAEQVAVPQMKLVGVKERPREGFDREREQTFTLVIKNSGFKPLYNCLVKVDKIANASRFFTPTALQTLHHKRGESSTFNLRGSETKELLLSWNRVTPGDSFLMVEIKLESGPYLLDPDIEPDVSIGMYSEMAPTRAHLKFSRNARGLLEVKEI